MDRIDLSKCLNGLHNDKRFKMYRDLWQKSEKFDVLLDFPLHLDIELSGICNLKCDACFQNNLIKSPLGLMKFDLFQRIIDEGVKKGLCAVKLQIRGESLLHPRIFDCIAYAKEKGVMDVQITTNGTLLNSKNIQKIMKSGLDAIILSVDSHHGSSFKIKNEQDYSEVERKIKNLLEARSRTGKSRPWVRLRSSIPQMHITYLRQTKAYLKQKFPEADIYIVGRIHDFRDDTDSFPDLHTSYEMLPCAYLMQRLAIFWNGDITTCCMDYNNRFQLGNVNYRTIQEAWLTKKMMGFRKLHLDNLRATMPICKHCHACLIARDPKILHDDTAPHPADYQ